MEFLRRVESWFYSEDTEAVDEKRVLTHKTKSAMFDLLWKVSRLMLLDASLAHYHLFELALMSRCTPTCLPAPPCRCAAGSSVVSISPRRLLQCCDAATSDVADPHTPASCRSPGCRRAPEPRAGGLAACTAGGASAPITAAARVARHVHELRRRPALLDLDLDLDIDLDLCTR